MTVDFSKFFRNAAFQKQQESLVNALEALRASVSTVFTVSANGLVPFPGNLPVGTPTRYLCEFPAQGFKNVETTEIVGSFSGAPYVIGYGGTVSLPVNVTAQIPAATDNLWLGRLGGSLAFYKRSHAETVTGDGVITDFQITHNLNTTDVIVQVWGVAALDRMADADYTVQCDSANALTVYFGVALGIGVQARIMIMAV